MGKLEETLHINGKTIFYTFTYRISDYLRFRVFPLVMSLNSRANPNKILDISYLPDICQLNSKSFFHNLDIIPKIAEIELMYDNTLTKFFNAKNPTTFIYFIYYQEGNNTLLFVLAS